MKKILFETSLSKIYIIGVILISLLIIGGYFSYAMFTITKEKNNAISIETGSLDYKLTVDGAEVNVLTIPAGAIRNFEVELSNPNDRIARFNLSYKEVEGVELGYLSSSESIPPEAKGINLEKSGTNGSSNIYNLRVRNETGEDIEIELIVKVGLDYNDLEIDQGASIIGEYEDILLKDYIMQLRNEDSNKDYSTSSDFEKKQMYTFSHSAASQQSGWSSSELTDYRYIGENPNNYVRFNDELWRIIGVFTVEKSDGTKEQLVKISKEGHLANAQLSWDANADKTYKDIWSQAEIQEMLNGAYLNSSTMTYYNYTYSTGVLTTVNLDFREEGSGVETGLSDVSDMIETVKWYTAAVPFNNWSAGTNLKAANFYSYERGSTKSAYGGPISWVGKVGLPYPSDYGFTVDYNFNTACYNNLKVNTACAEPRTWIYSFVQTTTTVLSAGSNAVIVTSSGLNSVDLSRAHYANPAVYLISNIIVTSGGGTAEDPFIFSLS